MWNNYKMLSVTCSIKQRWNLAQCSALGYRQHRAKQIAHCQNKLEKLTILLVLRMMGWPKNTSIPLRNEGYPQVWGRHFFLSPFGSSPAKIKTFWCSFRLESLLKTHYLQIGLHSVNMRTCTLQYHIKSKVPICSLHVNPIQNISITYIRWMLHYLYVTLEWINSMTG